MLFGYYSFRARFHRAVAGTVPSVFLPLRAAATTAPPPQLSPRSASIMHIGLASGRAGEAARTRPDVPSHSCLCVRRFCAPIDNRSWWLSSAGLGTGQWRRLASIGDNVSPGYCRIVSSHARSRGDARVGGKSSRRLSVSVIV